MEDQPQKMQIFCVCLQKGGSFEQQSGKQEVALSGRDWVGW